MTVAGHSQLADPKKPLTKFKPTRVCRTLTNGSKLLVGEGIDIDGEV